MTPTTTGVNDATISTAPGPGTGPGLAGDGNGLSSRQTFKGHVGEAGGHLKRAGRDAGGAIKSAAVAAGDELRVGTAQVKADLADSALAGMNAAGQARDAAREQTDELMAKGRDLMDSAAELIRERPLASFGAAFAAGWVIAKLARGGDR